jgi:hypothetical protein
MLGNCLYLPGGRAAAYNKIVSKRGEFLHLDNHQVMSFLVTRNTGA